MLKARQAAVNAQFAVHGVVAACSFARSFDRRAAGPMGFANRSPLHVNLSPF
jgi:hypothetical protein